MTEETNPDWFLREWLAESGKTVAWLQEQTGWTHRIASQLVNLKVRWNRDHLVLAARTLELEPWELLLPPAEALEIRNLRLSIARAAQKRIEGSGPQTLA